MPGALAFEAYPPPTTRADLGVQAFWSELHVEQSLSSEIGSDYTAAARNSPVLATFLAHSAQVCSVISLAGIAAPHFCFQLNGNGNHGCSAGPLITFSETREQKCMLNRHCLWEIAKSAYQRHLPQKANTCLLLTNHQLGLVMPTPAEIFPFSAVVVLSPSAGCNSDRDLHCRLQRALFDHGLLAVGAQRVEDCTAHCFLASELIRSPGHVGGATRGIVTMSSLGSNGRFGNQLFQYAYVKLYALRHGLEPMLPRWAGNQLFGLNDKDYAEQSCRELRFGAFDDSDLLLWQMHDPPADINLSGHFQELPACWERHRPFVRRLFQLVPRYQHGIESWHQHLTHGGKRALVAVHVRRTDYRYYSTVPWFRLVPEAWYVSWLRQIWPKLPDPVLFVATDEPETVLPAFNEFASVAMPATLRHHIIDFEILRRADHLAIANSSFSRMAALLAADTQRCVRPSFEARSFVPYQAWLDGGFWRRYSDGRMVHKLLDGDPSALP